MQYGRLWVQGIGDATAVIRGVFSQHPSGSSWGLIGVDQFFLQLPFPKTDVLVAPVQGCLEDSFDFCFCISACVPIWPQGTPVSITIFGRFF